VNEHIVNLILEVRGGLPEAKTEMLAIIDEYLSLPDDDRLNFAIGRRIGRYYMLSDMRNTAKYAAVAQYIDKARRDNPSVNFDRLCNDYRSQMI
jgi:hypothetical protein